MALKFPLSSWEIKTPRLTIRTPIPSDAEGFINLFTRAENLSFGQTEPEKDLTVESMHERFGRWNTRSAKGQVTILAVALRETGEIIGYMSFNCFRTRAESEGTEPERDEPLPGVEGRYLTDIGIVLGGASRRKGYSTEVLCGAAEYAFDVLGCQVMRMETSTANAPWRALMHSVGFAPIEQKATASDGSNEESYRYNVEKQFWQQTKLNLKAKKKWPLE